MTEGERDREGRATRAPASAGGDAGVEPIYVLDELQVRPGKLEAFLASMRADYLPGAEARGQRLIHTWVTPPTGIEGVPKTVILVWRLDGVPGFWQMRSQNASPEIAQWWSESETFIERRTRRFAAASDSLADLDALGMLNR